MVRNRVSFLNIYICDNNLLHMQYTSQCIAHYLKQKPSTDFHCVELLPEKLDELLSKRTFSADMIVLDIQMQWKNGIQLAEQINDISPRCPVIFLTAYIDYATMVYETKHIYFVLKSQMEEMLPKAIDKALGILNAEEPCLSLTFPSLNIRIPLSKIFYLEKNQHHTLIRTEIKDFMVPKSLRELSPLLGDGFLRCHGSYIVNLYHISQYSSTQFILNNGMNVPIGRTFQSISRSTYWDYLSSLLSLDGKEDE